MSGLPKQRTVLRIAGVVISAMLLARREACADGTAVTISHSFVEAGGDAEITVEADCELDLASFTLDVHLDPSTAPYVVDSAYINEDRVAIWGAHGPDDDFYPFELRDGGATLWFNPENPLFDVSPTVSSGSGWIFRFLLRTTGPASSAITSTIEEAEKTTIGPAIPFATFPGRLTAYELRGKPGDPTSDSTAEISIVGEGITHYRYQLDGQAYGAETPIDTPITLSNLSQGQHTLNVIVRDDEGHWQSQDAPTTHTWTVDASVPGVPDLASSAPDLNVPFNPQLGGDVQLTWTPEQGSEEHSYGWLLDMQPASDAPATVMDVDPPGALTSADFSAGDGPYYFHLRTNGALDGTGPWSGTVHLGPWLLDTTPPSAVLAVPPHDPNNQAASLVLAVSGAGDDIDRVVRYTYHLDADPSAEADVAQLITLLGLTPGVRHSLALFGRDVAGNWQTEATVYSWYTDVVPPAIGPVATDPAPVGWLTEDSAVITVQTRDPATDTESAIQGYSWAPTTDPGHPNPGFAVLDRLLPETFALPSGDGQRYLLIRAFDTAGNFTFTVTTLGPWQVDATSPDTSITTAAFAGPLTWPGRVEGTAQDAGSGVAAVSVRIRWDSDMPLDWYWDGTYWVGGGRSWLAASGTTSWHYGLSVDALTDGESYTIEATATDTAGNDEDTPAVLSLTYDATAPEISSAESVDATTVHITYSEPVLDADLTGSYAVDPELAVTDVAVQGDTYVLTTAQQAAGESYTLSAPGVTDRAGNAVANEAVFGVATEFSFPYGAGWSLIGVPVSSSQTVGDILGPGQRDSLKIGPLWTWWDGAFTRQRDDEAFVPERGYWMYALTAGQSRPVVGLYADGVIQLVPGWNLFSPVDPYVLPRLPEQRGPVWGWDAGTRTYVPLEVGAVLQPGQAYWVNVAGPGVEIHTR